MAVVALAVATTLLYTFGLSWAPIYLHFDEIRFAEHARSIATTGHDLNGRFMPVYFQIDGRVWFHPLGVYLPAIGFAVFPPSSALLRVPTALIGVLDVVLLYYVAAQVFNDRRLALLAGAFLAISPAHFIHSRMAVDYLFPTPFILGAVWMTLRYLDTRSSKAMWGAGCLLGWGIYSYIAALALMPLFLAAIIVLLIIESASFRVILLTLAGFALALIPGALFIAGHPEMIASTLGRYGIAANNLDLFQRARELLVPWTISDRANLYASFFSPGYLFVTGGGSLVGSTRAAGVLLFATLPLIVIGFRERLLKWSPASYLTLAGVFLPALAASVVAEQYAVGRAIVMVPFLNLLTVGGVQTLLKGHAGRATTLLLGAITAVSSVIGFGYLIFRGAQGEVSVGAVAIVALGVALMALAYAVRHTGKLSPIAAAVLIACVAQFAFFANDYFGDYRPRSAFWFNGNVKGAVTRIAAIIDSRQPPVSDVWLDTQISDVTRYWNFHLAELNRSDLASLGRRVSRSDAAILPLSKGTMFLAPAADVELQQAVERRGMRVVATISDQNDRQSMAGPGEHPVYLIYQAP